MGLIHCIYASEASPSFEPSSLLALLDRARANNASRDVTGILLHAQQSFFQVLEGPAAQVDALFDNIATDSRHARVVRIIREPIVRRAFGDWTMGLADVPSEAVDGIVGINDFFSGGDVLERLNVGRARKLLEAFARGRWRSSVRQ